MLTYILEFIYQTILLSRYYNCIKISAEIFSFSFKARIIERLNFLLPDKISNLHELNIFDSSA